VVFGPARFAEFSHGFHAMDEHFATRRSRERPGAHGLLNVWYVNFFKAPQPRRAALRQYLHRFPAYLQQLTMESNGKSVRWDGTPVTSETGEVFWGEPGTNGQHAFYQLIHQGTQLIPADFIAFANTGEPAAKDGDPTCTSCSWATSSPRPRRWPSARPPTRCAPRAPGGDRSGPGVRRQPSDHLDHRRRR
jgi:glucose-6-phosphate isomerase